MAPTAAAAKRLKSQWEFTQTIQKGIYHNKKVFDKEKGTFYYLKRKKTFEEMEDYELLLIDEASMVDYSTFLDLRSFEIPLLFMGDKAQLPPVKKQFINEKEKILFNVMDYTTNELTENFRQKGDSGILDICKKLRNRQKVEIKNKKDVLFTTFDKIKPNFLLNADQIIVSTNNWRNKINRWMSRENGNYTPIPIEGEKVIFIENNYEIKSDEDEPVVNSLMGTIEHIGNVKQKNIGSKTVVVAKATIKTECGVFKDIWVDIRPFVEGKFSDIIEVKKNGKKQFLFEDMCRIDFGYAITTYKAQGQEWDKVLYIQSGDFPRTKEESWQECYTACSRAREKMIVVPNISKKGYMWKNKI